MQTGARETCDGGRAAEGRDDETGHIERVRDEPTGRVSPTYWRAGRDGGADVAILDNSSDFGDVEGGESRQALSQWLLGDVLHFDFAEGARLCGGDAAVPFLSGQLILGPDACVARVHPGGPWALEVHTHQTHVARSHCYKMLQEIHTHVCDQLGAAVLKQQQQQQQRHLHHPKERNRRRECGRGHSHAASINIGVHGSTSFS